MKFNNRLYKMLCLSAITFTLFTQATSIAAPVATPVKKATSQVASSINYLNVSPLEIVNNPEKYLNKNITFNAETKTYSFTTEVLSEAMTVELLWQFGGENKAGPADFAISNIVIYAL